VAAGRPARGAAEDGFTGVVDLLRLRALVWADGCETADEGPVPDMLRNEAHRRRRLLEEAVAELHPAALEEYCGQGTVSAQTLSSALRDLTRSGDGLVVLTGLLRPGTPGLAPRDGPTTRAGPSPGRAGSPRGPASLPRTGESIGEAPARLYLRGLRGRRVTAVGCDLSPGMLRAAAHPALLNADVTALPLRDGAVDVALAIHMLYHVPSRETAIRELRRVVAAGGTCIAVTNGSRHTRSLRDLVERAAREETPGWQMRPATHAFTAENAAAQLGTAFETITCARPASTPPVIIRDAAVAADYVASLGLQSRR